VTSSDDRQRKLIRKPAYAQDIERIRQGSERAAEAVAAFERLITKIAEQGMAAPGGRPGVRSFPFHTDHSSYLVLYTFDAHKVVCLAVRPVRSSIF
jgi:ParE toxin of type II toxin-antitoxin system, parDE